MKKHKILIIHETLCGGGAEKVLIDMLSHFDYDRYAVDLLLWEGSGVYVDAIPEKVNVLFVHPSTMPFSHRIVMHIPAFVSRRFQKAWIENALDGRTYDTVISFLEGVAFRIHSILFDKSVRNLSWVHIDMHKNRWSDSLFSYSEAARYYQMLDNIVFVSDGARDAFLKEFQNVAAEKCRVIYNIQSPEKIRSLGSEASVERDKDKFVISCVGRLETQKRFDRVVELASLAKKSAYPFEFWIVGKGTLEKQLKAYAEQLGVESMIRFFGYQSNPYKYIASSDMFLLTSESEGYALVVGEAMSLGIPVVSTKVTGPLDLLKNNEGILCDENIDELFKAIVSLYESPALRKEYKARGFVKSRNFDPKSTMEKVYAIL